MDESQSDNVVAAFVDANAALLGLNISPDWRDGVIANMKTIAAAAVLVQAYPLPDELEAAPVFSA